ncbi:MAG: PTS system mannose/fructose/sorbose family transporter subunit IID [Firmicutes bacterium]|nr:PTS system mannose/fructose/sorbose family transporter subunit IID [Candidatus Fermentithermobacillaceae bacterium]
MLRRLARTKEEITSGPKRHLVFYNSHTYLGAMVAGVVAAMDVQKAQGADIKSLCRSSPMYLVINVTACGFVWHHQVAYTTGDWHHSPRQFNVKRLSLS